MKLFNDDATIAKEIKAIKVSGAKLQQRIHIVACSVLARWLETGDRRPMIANMTALVGAMPEMSRSNALKQWVELYSQHAKWDQLAKSFVWEEGQRYTITEEALNAAKAEPFWELKKEEAYKPVDFNALLKRLVKQAEKDMENAGEASSVDPEALEAIKALIK